MDNTHLLAAAAVGLLSGAACADIINVPAEFPTIQAAIDIAIDGDEVVVADGAYTGGGNKNLDFRGKLTVHSGRRCRSSWTQTSSPARPTSDQRALLEELEQVDDALDKASQVLPSVTRPLEKQALWGGPPKSCDFCGRPF